MTTKSLLDISKEYQIRAYVLGLREALDIFKEATEPHEIPKKQPYMETVELLIKSYEGILNKRYEERSP